jgi:polar amino acid transport system substrate-binding protein/cystine transport system substrate-binding protein/membrane-bound lytic murein transglycosylase F
MSTSGRTSTAPPIRERPRWLDSSITLAVVFGLLLAVYLLPPDTSLAELRRIGVLRACVPSDHPPLVTADAERPGIEVELLGLVAERLGVRLSLNTNSSMGRDINPRNWRVNRAQCQILAGGVLVTDTTRSYLDTTPPYLQAGWALIETQPATESLRDAKVGFFAGFSGFDRIALSRFLRAAGADVEIVNSREELIQGLSAGALDLGVTESLGAGSIAGGNGWTVRWLSGKLERYPVAFGLWKGDLTLKRAVEQVMQELEASSMVRTLIERYELRPIDDTFDEGTAGT